MAIWIDVRTADEFWQGHLDTAVNIPHDVIASEIGALTTDKNAEIHLYCGTGRRAGMAQQTLKTLGYVNTENAGSYDDLKAVGN